MNFGDYKQDLGMFTNGQRHSRDAQGIIEATWYDDPASTIGYLYDYYHDDEVDKNKNLHPEFSKTKTRVELKYILSSYRTLSKDEVDSRIMFKPSYRCNVPYYKEKFEKNTSGVFPTGLYLDLILPCGHRFQWVHDGKKYQMWGVERSQSS